MPKHKIYFEELLLAMETLSISPLDSVYSNHEIRLLANETLEKYIKQNPDIKREDLWHDYLERRHMKGLKIELDLPGGSSNPERGS